MRSTYVSTARTIVCQFASSLASGRPDREGGIIYIEVDIGSIPPKTTLHDADDLGSLKVVLRNDGHAFVSPAVIEELAAGRAEDPLWREQLELMLAFAREHGWVNDAGDVRAHVEL
jgi:hypothetical protein